jgi:hypothetical protein
MLYSIQVIFQMYDYFKLHRAACSNACRQVVIHPILISIIFQHYKQLTRLMEQRKAKNTTRELTSTTLDLWT